MLDIKLGALKLTARSKMYIKQEEAFNRQIRNTDLKQLDCHE